MLSAVLAQVLALSALSGVLATCCLVLLWCLIAAFPAAPGQQQPPGLPQQQQQDQSRRQISVYDEAYLPAVDSLPTAMSQCIAGRSGVPSTAKLAAECAAGSACMPLWYSLDIAQPEFA